MDIGPISIVRKNLIERLHEERDECRRENGQLQEERDGYIRKTEKLTRINEQKEHDLNANAQITEGLKNHVADLQKQMEELQKQNDQHLADLQKQIDDRKQQNEELQKNLIGYKQSEFFSSGRAAAGNDAEAILKRRQKKSVVFFHNNYYHHYFLTQELRRRGWDALSVSVDDPTSKDALFWHDADKNLFDPDKEQFQRNLDAFRDEILERFNMVFFYGLGRLSIYPQYWFNSPFSNNIPQDVLLFREHGISVGHSPTGCLDMISQSAYRRWSDGACNSCYYSKHPEMCSDMLNIARAQRIYSLCHFIEEEQLPVLEHLTGPNVIHQPLTFALDPAFWSPDLEIPGEHRIERNEGELLVYHGMANYDWRTVEGKNIKGTWAIEEAVERLKEEGTKVRLVFCKDMPNTEVRFYQAQADVVVDQLLLGRYGAQGREAMMLGKPVVGAINAKPGDDGAVPPWIEECPVVHATPETVYQVLKELLKDPERRLELGKRSREYALKYNSAQACADRFERIYEMYLP